MSEKSANAATSLASSPPPPGPTPARTRFRSSRVCGMRRFSLGNAAPEKTALACCCTGTLHRKKFVLTVVARLPSTIAVKVGCTAHAARSSSSGASAPSAAMAMHCLDTWYASKLDSFVSASSVTLTVTNGVSSMPSAARNCCVAARSASAPENTKPRSRGGCAKMNPTGLRPKAAATRSTVSRVFFIDDASFVPLFEAATAADSCGAAVSSSMPPSSSSSSKSSSSGRAPLSSPTCGGSYEHSTRTVFSSSSHVPYRTPQRPWRQPSCCT
mmetsp:Transcript_265/g.1022  ORF Transcript_265/g.1022 Transcript_265/m.1022 type:complete len:271 (+) Transcript_265:378-1190(+)